MSVGVEWMLALLLKPLFLIILFGCIVLPIEWVIWKLLPEGKLKRLLFFKWKA